MQYSTQEMSSRNAEVSEGEVLTRITSYISQDTIIEFI